MSVWLNAVKMRSALIISLFISVLLSETNRETGVKVVVLSVGNESVLTRLQTDLKQAFVTNAAESGDVIQVDESGKRVEISKFGHS